MERCLFFLIMLLLACSCQKEKAVPADIKVAETPVAVASTEYHFPEVALPDHFKMEAIRIYDTISRAEYHCLFPISGKENMKRFNKAIAKAMDGCIQNEKRYVGPYSGDAPLEVIFSYDMRPVAFYIDESIASITFVTDTYTEGGNHHNYSWTTFNYDLEDDKPLLFKDLFDLKAKKDSLAFINIVNSHNEKDWCTQFRLPLDSIDLSITEKGIYFNSDAWACWPERSLVPNDSCAKYMHAKWIRKSHQGKTK